MNPKSLKLIRAGLYVTGAAGGMLGASYLTQEAMLANDPNRALPQRLYGCMTGTASLVAAGAMFLFAKAIK